MNTNPNKPSFFGKANDLRQAIMFKPESQQDKDARAKWIKADAKDVFHKNK